jgi:hypothetical protein
VEVGYVNRVARLKTGNKRCSREPSSRLRSSDSRRALLPFLLDRSDEKNVFTSYADREIKGLELRDYEQAYATVYSGYDERELHLRWFLNRPGHRPLDLGDDIDAPDEARRYARGLLDGREDAIVNAYIDTRLTSTSTTVGVLRRLSCYGTRRSKRSKWRLKTAAGS